MLCRGWAWLSCRLELPPLTHPQHQLQYSLPTARLFRLPDVVRGLSASATTCDSLVLCYCVCCLADPVSPRPPQWSTHLQIPALLPPCHPASLLPAYSPPWVLGVNLSTAQADATVSFCRLQFHLPEPDAEPLSLPLELNSFNHLPVLASAFGSYKHPSTNRNGRENWNGKGAAANGRWFTSQLRIFTLYHSMNLRSSESWLFSTWAIVKTLSLG